MKSEINGSIVKEWIEFGHYFQIESLSEPIIKGASERHYRLWDNGKPATGGQWHYSIDNAVARAKYVLLCDYSDRIAYLETRVQNLERAIALGITPEVTHNKKGP